MYSTRHFKTFMCLKVCICFSDWIVKKSINNKLYLIFDVLIWTV